MLRDEYGCEIVSATIGIVVISVDLRGPVACAIGQLREHDTVVHPATAIQYVHYAASNPDALHVSALTQTEDGHTLSLAVQGYGKPYFEARLWSSSGPILARQAIDAFTIESTALHGIGVFTEEGGDGSEEGLATAILNPLLNDLEVTFIACTPGVSFEGGVTEFTVSSNEFVLQPDGSGTHEYSIYLAPDTPMICHRITVAQAHSPIEFVGSTALLNGAKAVFSKSNNVVCRDNEITFRYVRVEDATAVGPADMSFQDGNPATAQVPLGGSVNVSFPGGQLGRKTVNASALLEKGGKRDVARARTEIKVCKLEELTATNTCSGASVNHGQTLYVGDVDKEGKAEVSLGVQTVPDDTEDEHAIMHYVVEDQNGDPKHQGTFAGQPKLVGPLVPPSDEKRRFTVHAGCERLKNCNFHLQLDVVVADVDLDGKEADGGEVPDGSEEAPGVLVKKDAEITQSHAEIIARPTGVDECVREITWQPAGKVEIGGQTTGTITLPESEGEKHFTAKATDQFNALTDQVEVTMTVKVGNDVVCQDKVRLVGVKVEMSAEQEYVWFGKTIRITGRVIWPQDATVKVFHDYTRTYPAISIASGAETLTKDAKTIDYGFEWAHENAGATITFIAATTSVVIYSAGLTGIEISPLPVPEGNLTRGVTYTVTPMVSKEPWPEPRELAFEFTPTPLGSATCQPPEELHPGESIVITVGADCEAIHLQIFDGDGKTDVDEYFGIQDPE